MRSSLTEYKTFIVVHTTFKSRMDHLCGLIHCVVMWKSVRHAHVNVHACMSSDGVLFRYI